MYEIKLLFYSLKKEEVIDYHGLLVDYWTFNIKEMFI